jgi:hypothetical protein
MPNVSLAIRLASRAIKYHLQAGGGQKTAAQSV